jgi:GT2 family glycosyltransferase
MNDAFKPLVSVITVNFNHADYTIQMIDSLIRCNYDNIEIVVVDNASSNNDIDIIVNLRPEVVLLKLADNLGFAGANNKGIAIAKGEYFLLLNNDTEVVPGFLQELITVFEQYPDAGMVSPRLNYFYSDEKLTIQFAGARKINAFTNRGSSIGWGERDDGQYNNIAVTEFVHGAALMFNHRVLDTVGCMPDQYFLYYEEHDWCTAMQKKGLKAYYCGTALVYHKESISVGKNSLMKTYYMNRNRLLYLRRNSDNLSFYIALLFYCFVSLPTAIVRFVFKNEINHLKVFFMGIFWHFKHMYSFKRISVFRIAKGWIKIIN